MRVLKKVAIVMLFIGVIGFSLNMIFGMETITYITQHKTNGITYYKYDFFNYITGIRDTLANPSELKLTIQDLNWITIGSGWSADQFWQAIGNNLAYMLNVIITGLNVLLYPIRVGAYVLRFALTLIGLDITNTANPLYWLVSTVNTLIGLQIPFVQV